MEERKEVRTRTVEELEAELERERYKRRFRSALRGTIYTLVTVAACAILVAVLLLPVLEIYGTSHALTVVYPALGALLCVAALAAQIGHRMGKS